MTTPNGSPTGQPPRKLKILMLHGYTQSGPLFHAKTRALEKALHKAFPPSSPATPNNPSPATLPSYPGGISLLYLSAPHVLSADSIPGFDPSSLSSSADNDWRAWWVKDNTSGEYKGLEAGFQTIADLIAEEGGIDGVIGFSQGGCGAALVASLLEPGRATAFEKHVSSGGIAYPRPFLEKWKEGNGVERDVVELINGNQQLKFGVSYSGFFAPDTRYAAFYEPKIATPILHFIGSLDSVVEEDRSMGLVERCENATLVVHPGGHFVPVGREWITALVAFIRETCGEAEVDTGEESVEDMDVPF